MASKNKPPELLSNKQIIILGPQRLQNELMASYLAGETGASCLESEDFYQIPLETINKETLSALFLLDCQGKDLYHFLADLALEDDKMMAEHFVALFNLQPTSGNENKALERGIRGFFYSSDPLDLFPKGVRAIFTGELWVSREILSKCVLDNRGKETVTRTRTSLLTSREVEILSLVSAGAKNEEIADKLCISPNTVRTHIYNIFKKIDVPNRLQAALWAAHHL
jgi:LuxR family transcriptional regulator, positive regulator of biofilm formation